MIPTLEIQFGKESHTLKLINQITMQGRGYQFLMVILLTAPNPIQKYQVPSFLSTKKIREAKGKVLSLINPLANKSYI